MTPIVLIIYNRPDNVRAMLDALRPIAPRKIYVIADGPKAGNEERVISTRAAIDDIDWECNVIKIYADENMGCDARIISGLTDFFEHEERGIILEDDCIPNESFIKFASELLDVYAENESIAYISGTNPIAISRSRLGENVSYAFSKRGDTWGWATWKRTWDKVIDRTESFWRYWDVEAKFQLEASMGKRRAKSFIREVESCRSHMCPWDYQMLTAAAVAKQLSIVPAKNLISNIGFNEDSTHTKDVPEGYGKAVEELEFPLVHPKKIVVDRKYDRRKYNQTYLNDFRARLLRYAKRKLNNGH